MPDYKDDLKNRLNDIVIQLRKLHALCEDLDRMHGVGVLDVSLRQGSASSKNRGCVSIQLYRGIDDAAAALNRKFNEEYLTDTIYPHKEFNFTRCTFVQSPVTITTQRYLQAGENKKEIERRMENE